MNEAGGRTYGYGRVSRIAPSPYSPLHVPSQLPGAAPALPHPSRPRRSRVVRLVLLAVVVALVGLAAGALHFRAPVAVPEATRPHPAGRPALSDEADRLQRSAIATSVNSRPRS